jgi:hypothetical protein
MSVFYQFSGRMGPSAIAIDTDGNLYVARYDFAGEFSCFFDDFVFNPRVVVFARTQLCLLSFCQMSLTAALSLSLMGKGTGFVTLS